MNQTILNLWQENGILSIINLMQIMMKEIKLSITQVLISNLCDYNDAYILVRGDITIIDATQVTSRYHLKCHWLIEK